MEQYIRITINAAMRGDILSIIKCFGFIFIIRIIYVIIRDITLDSCRKIFRKKTSLNHKTKSKLTDHGYSKSIIAEHDTKEKGH